MFAIVGGGIAGLTTALAFEKFNIPYVVYERAEEINAVGAGIWLAPNALQVLDWLGLSKDILMLGNEVEEMSITDHKLIPIGNAPGGFEEKFGFNTCAIHRARLQTCLYKNLPAEKVKLGWSFKEVQRFKNDPGINIVFENQADQEALHLIAADGIHSNVRNQLFPESEIRDTGQICWRGISKITLPEEYLHRGFELWGNRIRFGFSRIHKGEVYWFAVAKKMGENDDDLQIRKIDLLERFKDFHPLANALIEHTPKENIIRNKLLDLRHMLRWYNRYLCLIGDAGHATTPNMGQGGAQAIEDAYYLANLLHTNPNVHEAFRAFQDMREKKVRFVVNQSWQLGQIAHWKYLKSARNLLLRLTPDSLMKKQLENLYSIPDFNEDYTNKGVL